MKKSNSKLKSVLKKVINKKGFGVKKSKLEPIERPKTPTHVSPVILEAPLEPESEVPKLETEAPEPLLDPETEVEPPPAPPKAKSIAGVIGNWQRFHYREYCFLVYNKTDSSIAAHCPRHGGRCRAPKL